MSRRLAWDIGVSEKLPIARISIYYNFAEILSVKELNRYPSRKYQKKVLMQLNRRN